MQRSRRNCSLLRISSFPYFVQELAWYSCSAAEKGTPIPSPEAASLEELVSQASKHQEAAALGTSYLLQRINIYIIFTFLCSDEVLAWLRQEFVDLAKGGSFVTVGNTLCQHQEKATAACRR
jgi:hypothetical protein